MLQRSKKLTVHMEALAACARCPDMGKPVVMGHAVSSKVLLVGQAPGDKEPVLGRPFAWTAGKNLFKWFASIGLDEDAFRSKVYMAAVCRCFPGKNPKGGDRVPSPDEIAACRPWLDAELALLRPDLVIALGATAAQTLMGPQFRVTRDRGRRFTVPGAGAFLATIHPSAILRMKSGEREAGMASFISDLKAAARLLHKARHAAARVHAGDEISRYAGSANAGRHPHGAPIMHSRVNRRRPPRSVAAQSH